MRYREEHIADAAVGGTDAFITGSAVLGLLIGIGFVVAGIRGRQIWLATWGGSLVVASAVYVGGLALGLYR